MQTYTVGTTPEVLIVQLAQDQCPEGYPIECHQNCEDFDSLQRMTAQGIDAHLTAIRFEEFEGAHGKRGFQFPPESLGVLCRRLAESEEENDWDLRTGILYTLGIEEI